MRLRLEITGEELAQFARELFPASFVVSPRRVVHVSEPTHVGLVEGRGLRLAAMAHLQWDALGLPLQVAVRDLQLLLAPVIDGEHLRLRPVLERLDLERLPGFVEQAIVSALNELVRSKTSQLSFPLLGRLRAAKVLPGAVMPRTRLALEPDDARIVVTAAAIVLELGATVGAGRVVEPASVAVVTPPSTPAPSSAPSRGAPRSEESPASARTSRQAEARSERA